MTDGLDTARREAVAKITERRQRAPFIKGPIPLGWITTAARLPGKSLAVGLALWWRRNLTGDNTVKLTSAHSLRFGVQTRSGRKAALDALEQAGLVEVERRPPKAPSVTLIDADPPPPRGRP